MASWQKGLANLFAINSSGQKNIFERSNNLVSQTYPTKDGTIARVSKLDRFSHTNHVLKHTILLP
jgi:hypothetical protein